MLLSDREIRTLCQKDPPLLTPFSEGVKGNGVISYGLTHAGYDLRLGEIFWVFKNTYGEVVDPKRFCDHDYIERVLDKVWVKEGGTFLLAAHSYVLARTLETIHVPRHVKGRVVGKSTLARCGVFINCTPLEPSWCGVLVLEIGNTSPSTIRLYPGEGIAQLELELLYAEPEQDYADKAGVYQGQQGIVPARVL